MNNEEKLTSAFCKTFEITPDKAVTLKFQEIDAWDSVGHMGLVSELEETFDIMLEPDDIVDMSSYQKAKEILTKYGISF